GDHPAARAVGADEHQVGKKQRACAAGGSGGTETGCARSDIATAVAEHDHGAAANPDAGCAFDADGTIVHAIVPESVAANDIAIVSTGAAAGPVAPTRGSAVAAASRARAGTLDDDAHAGARGSRADAAAFHWKCRAASAGRADRDAAVSRAAHDAASAGRSSRSKARTDRTDRYSARSGAAAGRAADGSLRPCA